MTTPPLFLVEPGRLDGLDQGGCLRLDGTEGRHAAAVRRIGPEERVDVSDGVDRLARCTVTSATRDTLFLRVSAVVAVPEPSPRLVLAQALAKGGRDEQAVETATEVGVDAVVPWQAERSVVQWRGERGAKALRRWQSTVRAAAKQARRPRVPVVEPALQTQALAARLAGAALALVLHESAGTPLSAVQLPRQGELLVVVGPEGGVGPVELGVLLDAGARAVRLGPEVLRTSTAGPVALALLSDRLGRWA